MIVGYEMDGSAEDISRVRRTHDESRLSYDRLAPVYDLLSGSVEGRLREVGLRLLDAREGERILEIGFGTGRALSTLARAVGGRGEVVGVDISSSMFGLALRRLRQTGFANRVRLRRGDALKADFKPDSFDAVFLAFSLELFDTPEIPVLLERCRKALKPGGRICVAALSKEGRYSLMLRLYEWAHRVFPRRVDCRPIYAGRSLEKAGFRIENAVRAVAWGLPVEIVLARV